MAILIFFVALWYCSLFCQTFFQHRYAAHGAFKMSKGWERFFFILTYITQGSSYLSPRAYAAMHRLHHAYADTEKDPHSPKYSKNLMDMMWKTRNVYAGIFYGTIPVEDKYMKNLPDWPAFDRWADGAVSRTLWIGVYAVIFAYLATSPWLWLLFPLVIVMGPLHGAVVNWYAHKYGYINFKIKNTAMNLLRVDFLMLGESYHNNHHKHPASPNFGRRWHEVDPIYPIILLFNKVGIINISKATPIAFDDAPEHHHDHQPRHKRVAEDVLQ